MPSSTDADRLAAARLAEAGGRAGSTPSPATTALSRPSSAARPAGLLHGSPISCAPSRPAATCSARDGRGHVPAGPLRPHRLRHGRDRAAKWPSGEAGRRSEELPPRALGGCRTAALRRRRAGAAPCGFCAAALALGAAACHRCWRRSALARRARELGPFLALGRRSLDRRARPRGQAAAPLPHADGRWKLPVDARDVDPRYLAMLKAFEDRRFEAIPASTRWRLRARRGRCCAMAASSPAARP